MCVCPSCSTPSRIELKNERGLLVSSLKLSEGQSFPGKQLTAPVFYATLHAALRRSPMHRHKYFTPCLFSVAAASTTHPQLLWPPKILPLKFPRPLELWGNLKTARQAIYQKICINNFPKPKGLHGVVRFWFCFAATPPYFYYQKSFNSDLLQDKHVFSGNDLKNPFVAFTGPHAHSATWGQRDDSSPSFLIKHPGSDTIELGVCYR